MYSIWMVVWVLSVLDPGTRSEITNIDYPPGLAKYENRLVETFNVGPRELTNFTLNFATFDLEESYGCKADNFTVWNILRETVKLGPICGLRKEPWVFNTLDYGLFFILKTDISWTGRGFDVLVHKEVPDVKQVCDIMLDQTLKRITSNFSDNFKRYPSSLDCDWEIDVAEGFTLVIWFEIFNIEYSGRDCEHDKLDIWESGGNGSVNYTLQRRLCGRHEPWSFYASNKVSLRFFSDSSYSKGRFHISYFWLDDDVTNEMAAEEIIVSHLSNNIEISSDDSPQLLRFKALPGFKVELGISVSQTDRYDLFEYQTLIAYDGPGEEYEHLNPHNVSENLLKLVSSGFYLTLKYNADLEDYVLLKINYRVPLDTLFTPETTSVVIKRDQDFFSFPRDSGNKNIRYFSFAVTEGKYPRIAIDSFANFFETNPNINDCEKTGIVLYQGEVKYQNILGPFCDITPNYVQNILETIIGSSSVLHAAVYDYANMYGEWDIKWFVLTESRCKGYQFTDHMFEERNSIETETFNLTYKGKKIKEIEMWTKETVSEECYVLLLLPDKSKWNRYNFTLIGNSDYTICARWIPSEVTNFEQKFETNEDCTVDLDEPQSNNSFGTQDNWTIAYYWIKIGPVSRYQCGEVPVCYEGNIEVDVNCGVFRADYPPCKLILQKPLEGYWQLDLSKVNSDVKTTDALVVFEEWPQVWSEKTTVSYHKIGEGRTFRYKTIGDEQVTVSTENVRQIVLSFEQLPRESLEKNNPDCYNGTGNIGRSIIFGGHCYFLIEQRADITWEDAQVECVGLKQDALLVSINTIVELNFLKKAIMDIWSENIDNKDKTLMFIGLKDLAKAGDYIWQDRSPLTVSDWYYPFAPFDHVLSADNSRLVVTEIQPVADTSKRCAVMVPRNTHFSTNWMKVSCTTQLIGIKYSICEFDINRNEMEIKEPTENIFGNLSACAYGWNFVANRCLAVLTHDAPPDAIFTVQDAEALCHDRGGKMASISQFKSSTLKSFLFSLNMADTTAGFWYNSVREKGCLFKQMLDTQKTFEYQLNESSPSCNLIFGQPSNVICESNPDAIVQDCQKYQFMCQDKTCLTPDLVCDGFDHCSGGEDEIDCSLSMNFECFRQPDISLFKYCDFRVDCKEKDDEKPCVHRNCTDAEWQCENKECIPKDRRCDHKPDCIDGTDERNCDWGMECKSFRCSLVGCIPLSKVEDIHPDCPDATESDERQRLDKKMFPSFYSENGAYVKTNTFRNECPGYVDQQRCHIDHDRCYPRHSNCIFEKDVYGSLSNCRNGFHLNNCEDFQCPGFFKCKQSYCIPIHKICDGTNDCIDGEDESSCTDYTCPYQLRCGTTKQCVSQEDVCDGTINCKSSFSDELYCDLTDWSCPDDCSCFGYTMSCPDLKLEKIPTVKFLSNLRILNFTLNHLSISNTTLQGYRSLAYLYLSQNFIKALQSNTFSHSPNMLFLDLSDNRLEIIEERTFYGLVNLKTLLLLRNPIHTLVDGSFWELPRIISLNLSSMAIKRITTHAFDGMKRVEELDLSYNEIDLIEPGSFSSEKLKALKTLLLVGNSMDSTGEETFRGIAITKLHTSSFRFCCFAEKVPECKPIHDIYSSCTALLDNNFLRAVVWLTGLLAVVANGVVIIWRIYDKIPNVPSIFVLNLAMSDALMGIFLITICLVDAYYRGEYVSKDVEWRASMFCSFVGVMAMVAVEMSMFTLVVIAVDRTKRLAFPFSDGQIRKNTAWIIEITGWIICLMLALIPLMRPSYFGSFYGRNSICVPFNLSEMNGMGWEYATTIFVVLNSSAMAFMIALYIVIYFKVKEEEEEVVRTDLELARSLSMTITSNMVCIIPVILANISAVTGSPVSQEMSSLLTAVLLPLNTVLNPCIFILSQVRSIRVAKQRIKEAKQTNLTNEPPNAKGKPSENPYTITKFTNLSTTT